MPAGRLPQNWGFRLLLPVYLIGRLVRAARKSASFKKNTVIPVSEGSEAAQDPLSGSVSLRLPLELWAEIFEYIEDRAYLTRVACVCHPLRSVIERILYRSVALSSDYRTILFHRTVTTSSHLASLVRHYDVTVERQIYTRVPPCILETVQALPQLQRLVIHCDFSVLYFPSFRPTYTSPQAVFASYRHIFLSYKAIFALRFPDLREFSTNISLLLCPQILTFVCAHPGLQVLEMEMWDPSRVRIPDLASLSSLRTLACFPYFLRSQTNTETFRNVTRLYLFQYTFEDLVALARDMGPQLVSLRLDSSDLVQGPGMWTLGDVAAMFPRLRLLHLDFGNCYTPSMPNTPINWDAQAQYVPSEHALLSAHLTVVWAYPQLERVQEISEASWHSYVNQAAYDVLARWTPYVQRVVYRHVDIPYVSVTLSADGARLVQAENTDMSDEYWKSV